jgi:glycosyltransferase involved in cell wall biosynthesis
MTRPRFSVVIPTRERAGTLRHSLRTCLDQDFDDYEIVVADNASSPATKQVVDEAASPRIRYLRSDRPLAMSANWERAVAAARGEYVTVLGDDDGLLPFALRELDGLARRHGTPPAVHWHRGIYTWPDLAVPADANLLKLPLDRWVRECDGRSRIAAAARYEIGADMLPMIYNAAVHHSLLDRHRQLAGRVFPNLYPDVYTGFAFAYLAGTFLSVGVPLGIAGLSGHSNGVSFLQVKGETDIAGEFVRLHAEAGYRPHPTVPPLRLPPVHVADCFQFAKDLLFPADDDLVLDRQAATIQFLAHLPAEPGPRAAARRAVRDSLADRPDLLTWFDTAAPDPPPAPPASLRGGRPPGYDGYELHLDAAALGARTILDAVRLAAGLIGPGPVRYDLPSRSDLVDAARLGGHDLPSAAAIARAGQPPGGDADPADLLAAAEARLADAAARLARAEADLRREREARAAAERRAAVAERCGALRNVPRRLARKVVGLVKTGVGA